MIFLKQLSKTEKIVLGFYIIASVLLLLYSFTQIDLGLVISRFPFLYAFEKAFQNIGYFNRPLSTLLFILLVLLFSGMYLYVVGSIKHISRKAIWMIVLSVSVILFLSYNAFSYDVFNYIFDAKILTQYHANPYLHKALDYPADPMLSFMHWTHRVYPYGPVWLAVTVPLSYLGMGLFLPTFYLFKLLILASYVGTTYVIGKILRIISPESEIAGMVIFALNPLVIFETLISAHNDIFMMFLMVLSLYLLLKKNMIWSVFITVLSIATKFATLFLLPMYVLLFLKRKNVTEKYWNTMMFLGVALMFLAVLVVSYRSNFQPWYLLYILPFISLITKNKSCIYPSFFLSIIALGNYLPYLYMGTWTDPVMQQLFWINSISGLISAIWFSILVTKNSN
jgi:hypothetical protein